MAKQRIHKRHDPQYHEAMRILNLLPTNICTQLYKTPRAGATTGLCASAIDTGLKFTLIASRIKIATDTLDESKIYTEFDEFDIDTPNIPGNRVCERIVDEIDKHKDLAYLPMIPLPMKCDGCDHFHECPVTEFLRAENPDGVGLTHQKLNALMHSSSDTAVAVVEKLMSMSDLVIIDEAHNLETNNAATVMVYPYPETDKYVAVLDKYNVLKEQVELFDDIRREYDESGIQNLLGARDKSKSALMSIKIRADYEPPEFKDTVSAINAIIEIMKHRADFDLTIKDVLYLNNIVMTLSGHQLVMHYIKDDGVEYIHISSPGGLRNAIRQYVINVITTGKSRIVFTTATFSDYYYGNMFGMDINKLVLHDTCHTNELMTIYPDKRRISTYDYWREETGLKQRIMKEVCTLHSMYPGIRIVCMKMTVAYNIGKWGLEMGHKLNVDYYRSTNSEGVRYDKREIVCVGAPVCAINAHDGISDSFEESQRLRVNGDHAAFWQAISRVKDPMGRIPSTVFCIGIRENEVRKMCTWGIGRKIEMDGIKCESVSVIDNEGIGMPVIIDLDAQRFLDILREAGSSDRSYLMRHCHIKAKELDEMLQRPQVLKHVDITTQKTGRKSKFLYTFVE